jgi:hypothetical protein
LNYYGYRYYSAAVGRWLSRDPIGENGGFNVFGFVEGNPVSRMDELGLFGNPVYGPDGPVGKLPLTPPVLVLPPPPPPQPPVAKPPTRPRVPVLNPVKVLSMKPCGKLIRRVAQPLTIPYIRHPIALLSAIGLPHYSVEPAHGDPLDHGGNPKHNSHWTSIESYIMIPNCMSCKEFSECMKIIYGVLGEYNEITNNCKSGSLEMISRCGGLVGNGAILTDANPGGGRWDIWQRNTL